MIAEPNLYNPAIFADISPDAWDIANEYLDFIEKYPAPLSYIRGHVFKIFHKVLDKHKTERDDLGKIREIKDFREAFNKLKQLCLADLDLDNNNNNNNNGINYWQCQSYIRPTNCIQNAEIRDKVDETRAILNTNSGELIETYKELEESERLKKSIERKKRKQEKAERKEAFKKRMRETNPSLTSPATLDLTENDQIKLLKTIGKKVKYLYCDECRCNPRSGHCDYNLCRMCCKDKIFKEQLDCKGKIFNIYKNNIKDEEIYFFF
jgi:tRNA-dihydrouridine synthase 1